MGSRPSERCTATSTAPSRYTLFQDMVLISKPSMVCPAHVRSRRGGRLVVGAAGGARCRRRVRAAGGGRTWRWGRVNGEW